MSYLSYYKSDLKGFIYFKEQNKTVSLAELGWEKSSNSKHAMEKLYQTSWAAFFG